jgi:hypothetical protein
MKVFIGTSLIAVAASIGDFGTSGARKLQAASA